VQNRVASVRPSVCRTSLPAMQSTLACQALFLDKLRDTFTSIVRSCQQ